MATVTSRATVDQVILHNGVYPDDPIPVVKIVEYNNMFDGGVAWGLVYEGENPQRYHQSGACINPRTIWERVVGGM
jgi:hypothetical protein